MSQIEILFAAVRQNNTDKIKEVVKNGVDINTFGPISVEDRAKFEIGVLSLNNLFTLTALHLACLYGYLEAVETCIALGANVNIESRMPPIHCAVIGGNTKILDCLAQHGADLFKTASYTINSPFMDTSFSFPKKQSYAYDNLNDLLQVIKAQDSDISTFITHGALKSDERGSCLYQALSLGHTQQIQQLLKAGVTIQAKHYYAAGLSHQFGANPSMVYQLLPAQETQVEKEGGMVNHSADFVRLLEQIKNNQIVSINAHYEALSKLLEEDEKGSCLYFALANHNQSVVIELLKAGAMVKNKHYYAAGLSQNGKALFEMLKESQKTCSPNFESNDPYDILGVSHYASQKQIKSAWNKWMLTYHPDRYGQDNENSRKLNTAYGMLKNSFYSSSFSFYQQKPSPSPMRENNSSFGYKV